MIMSMMKDTHKHILEIRLKHQCFGSPFSILV